MSDTYDLVRRHYPGAAVYELGSRPHARYAVVSRWPDGDDKLSLIGSWCKSADAAWASAARRIVEDRPGPGGCGNR